MSLEIKFKGFFECRLATDSDHYEEPRGTGAGWTFATPEEPDLDRIIRFQPDVAIQRQPGVSIGVSVTGVQVNGAPDTVHPLIGARVDLRDNPVFEGQNWQVAPDGREPIFPFHIAIEGSNIALSREMRDPTSGDPALELAEGRSFSPDLFAESGIGDPATYRAARTQAIADRIAAETDSAVKDGLNKRLANIQSAGGGMALMWGPVPAQVFVNYDYRIAHPDGVIHDPGGLLPAIDIGTEWRFQCSLGVWDADVLAGFAIGSLNLPLAP